MELSIDSPMAIINNLFKLKENINFFEVYGLYNRVMGTLAKDVRFNEINCRISTEGKEIKADFVRCGDPKVILGDITCAIFRGSGNAGSTRYDLCFSYGFPKDLKDGLSQIIEDVAKEKSLGVAII